MYCACAEAELGSYSIHCTQHCRQHMQWGLLSRLWTEGTDVSCYTALCNWHIIYGWLCFIYNENDWVVICMDYEVAGKHIWSIWLIGQLDSFGNDWHRLLHGRVDILNNILMYVLGTVFYRNFQYMCGIHVLGNGMIWLTFYAPPCIN